MPDLDHLLQYKSTSDPQVIQTLVDRFYAYIYRLSLSILGDASEADDAAQETFIRAAQKLEYYQTGTCLKSWLSTIAVNICRDMLRRKRTRQALLGALKFAGRLSNQFPTPEEITIENERRDALWLAVQSLGDKHRLPLILRYVHGMNATEIAQILEISEGTVYSRMHYAVRKLQAQLEQDSDHSIGEQQADQGNRES